MLYWAGFESMLCATLPKNKSGCVGKTISNKRRSMSEIFFVCRLIKGACQGESVLLLMYLRGKECVCRIDMGIPPPPIHPVFGRFSRGEILQMPEETSVIDNRSCLLMTLQHSTLYANSFYFSETRFPRDISSPWAPTFERSNTASRNTYKHICNPFMWGRDSVWDRRVGQSAIRVGVGGKGVVWGKGRVTTEDVTTEAG